MSGVIAEVVMAKKAAARKTATKKAATKKVAAKRTPAPKPAAQSSKAAGGRLVSAAERIGRTLGRAASGVDNVRALATRVVGGRSRKKKMQRDPEAEAERERSRAAWKSQAKAASSVELARQVAVVDERARVRATAATRWANRKPR